jgi:hypothetical protein
VLHEDFQDAFVADKPNPSTYVFQQELAKRVELVAVSRGVAVMRRLRGAAFARASARLRMS